MKSSNSDIGGASASGGSSSNSGNSNNKPLTEIGQVMKKVSKPRSSAGDNSNIHPDFGSVGSATHANITGPGNNPGPKYSSAGGNARTDAAEAAHAAQKKANAMFDAGFTFPALKTKAQKAQFNKYWDNVNKEKATADEFLRISKAKKK
jgi:hypothetical protein